MEQISKWVEDTYHYLPEGGKILDLACGHGRHSQFLEAQGFEMTAVDIDVTTITQRNLTNTAIIQADLEGTGWPFLEGQFDGVVVVNYLWRRQLSNIFQSIKSGGVLIYDTFCVGNEKYGRPRNSDFLLQTGELKAAFGSGEVLAFEEGYREMPSPSMRQSIVLRKK